MTVYYRKVDRWNWLPTTNIARIRSSNTTPQQVGWGNNRVFRPTRSVLWFAPSVFWSPPAEFCPSSNCNPEKKEKLLYYLAVHSFMDVLLLCLPPQFHLRSKKRSCTCSGNWLWKTAGCCSRRLYPERSPWRWATKPWDPHRFCCTVRACRVPFFRDRTCGIRLVPQLVLRSWTGDSWCRLPWLPPVTIGPSPNTLPIPEISHSAWLAPLLKIKLIHLYIYIWFQSERISSMSE